MTAAVRRTSTLWVLSLTVVVTGCGVKSMPSSFNPKIKDSLPKEASFTLVDDGSGGCRKQNVPDVMIAFSNETIVWHVTNNCGRDATVFLDQFKVKHKVFHLYPFKNQLAGTPVSNGATVPITATVKDTNDVGDLDMKGFQVYKYRVRVVAGGRENKHDPEIILDWP
jgi:hypothetical protein